MSDTRRQQCITALATAMATITTANGYQTNAGSNVRVDPDKDLQPLSAAITTAITVRETGGAEQAGMVGENFGVIEVDLVAQARGTASESVDQKCRQIAGDINISIGEDKTLGGLADDVVVSSHAFEVSQGKDRIGSMTISARLSYRTARFDPFTAAT